MIIADLRKLKVVDKTWSAGGQPVLISSALAGTILQGCLFCLSSVTPSMTHGLFDAILFQVNS
jgi:hypothetical protein